MRGPDHAWMLAVRKWSREEERRMPMMACVGCGSFLKIKKNGVSVEELMPDGGGGWQPYKLWSADLYGCERCGVEVVAGFGHGPVAEHFQDCYQRMMTAVPPIVRVNDCPGTFKGK